mgnify:CR=1 FL=1
MLQPKPCFHAGVLLLIDKLELLLALARERHFGRAAESCGVTQPTMSTGLKQLEEILGVMLVHRGSRFVGFTPEGERALDWARRIVSDTRAMRQDINSFKGNLSGELRIAAIPTVLGMVASLTTPFRARHPDVRFRVVSCTSSDVLGLLENRSHLIRERTGGKGADDPALSRKLSLANGSRRSIR